MDGLNRGMRAVIPGQTPSGLGGVECRYGWTRRSQRGGCLNPGLDVVSPGLEGLPPTLEAAQPRREWMLPWELGLSLKRNGTPLKVERAVPRALAMVCGFRCHFLWHRAAVGSLKLSADWDDVRGDPRFAQILEESARPIDLISMEDKRATEPPIPEKSIAVLPFQSLSESECDPICRAVAMP